MKTNRRKRAAQMSILDRVTRSGSWGGYEMTGWRCPDDASWRVKVWPAGQPGSWIGHKVAAGVFELKMVALAQREAVLHVIGEWESE